MAHQNIKLKTFYDMPAQERDRTLSELVRGASSPRNGQAAMLHARIREFEVRFEMASAELHQRLRDGIETETAEIAKWLFLLDTRGNMPSQIVGT